MQAQMGAISRIEFRARQLSALTRATPSANAKITGICNDSRQVQPGDAFLCMPRAGTQIDNFARMAKENGAVALITIATRVGRPITVDLPTLELPDMESVGQLLRKLLKTDSFDIPCVGITGTDGKTSITWMLREALSRKFRQVWSTGTLGLVRANDDITDIGNTTPSLMTNHQLMQHAMNEGVDAVVMEVSSHGIDQDRIAALPINTAIWTNLGHDHLQDHGGFDVYASLKARFIMQTIERGGISICNADDENICRLMAESATAENKRTAHWYAHGLYTHEYAARFGHSVDLTWEQELPGMVRFAYKGEEVRIEDIPAGEFHAENLAAVALTLILRFGIKLADLPSLLDGISAPPGRMQALDVARWQVFIDYAHTPEALERCLETGRKLARNRLMVVFGCGGDRDREKRPEMGHVAVTMADVVWITSDNPRGELPEVIASEIENGMPKPYPAEVHLELDRKQAICDAIDAMQPGDLLIVAGKGHEAYMEIEDRRFEWSDFAIADGCLHAKENKRMQLCA